MNQDKNEHYVRNHMCSYERLKKDHPILLDINKHFINTLLKGVTSKLSVKEKFFKPYEVLVKKDISVAQFNQIYKAVRDFDPKHRAKLHTSTREESLKDGRVLTRTLVFTDIYDFVFHMNKLTESNIETSLMKMVNKNKLQVVIDQSNPLTIKYVSSKTLLTLHCKYEVVNQYGTVVSY